MSPIIPIKIVEPNRTVIIVRMILERGIYANCIVYAGIARKDARIKPSLMTPHTKDI